jgi:hypothetical protein
MWKRNEDDEVAQLLKKKIETWRTRMPCFVDLGNPALKTRHWKQIFDKIGRPAQESFTLQEILDWNFVSIKDTIADIIMQYTPYHRWQVKKFAGKLKDIAEILTGVPKINFEDQEFKQQDMGPEWGMTYRDLLQKLGTEAMRSGLHKNVWVNALFADYQFNIEEDEQIPYWIITDSRFPNELAAVKKHNGITIKVIRDSGNTIGTIHTSETALDDYTEWDYVINNNGGATKM